MSDNKPIISVIGGDMRQAYLALLLQQHGFCVTCFCVPALPFPACLHSAASLREAITQADVIVGGIPLCKGDVLSVCTDWKDAPCIPMADFLSLLHPCQTLIGGVIPPFVWSACEEKEITCLDFMAEDSFAIYNAIATAEGSIAEAVLHHPANLQGTSCLVFGYGRCAKILSEKLKVLHSDVTVCARSETDLAYAAARGMKTLSFCDLPKYISAFSYLFNTVPGMVLTEPLLEKMQPDALIIDIASAPGGVDYPAARRLGIQALLCPGLPGRYAPKSSAEGMLRFLAAHTNINVI